MKRAARRVLGFVGASVLVALPLGAAEIGKPGAPADQYDNFDRFNSSIFDKKTRLTWQRLSSATMMTYADAVTFCANSSPLGVGARIPTVKELHTLLDEEPHAEYVGATLVTKMIDPGAFGLSSTSTSAVAYTPVNAPYWSSTPAADPSQRWTLDFKDGKMRAIAETAPAASAALVRCVK